MRAFGARAATASTCSARRADRPSIRGAIREVLARPGVLEDISAAYDSPATTVDDWVDVIEPADWLAGRRGRRLRRGRAAHHRRSAAARVLPPPPPWATATASRGVSADRPSRGCGRSRPIRAPSAILAQRDPLTPSTAEPACPGPARIRGSWPPTPGGSAPSDAERRRVRPRSREPPGTRLAARNPWATPFSGWAFHRAWWDAYGANAHERDARRRPSRRAGRWGGRADRDRAADASPRGGADRRRDPHDDAARHDAGR